MRVLVAEHRLGKRALQSSVLPTPVGPRKRKLPIGPVRVLEPDSAAPDGALPPPLTASFCPITRRCSTSSICSSRSLSLSVRLVTGMPVQPETTAAISSADTAPR